MLKKNRKELFIAFAASVLGDLVLMMVYYYLHNKQGVFPEFDIARATTVAIVLTAFIAGIICYVRHKKDDNPAGITMIAALCSFAGAFIGSVSGTVIAANIVK
ncbi:MAG: hypothetical protein IKH90_03880 [Ruminococcus sp.]|nr:hypothetical protein [Ruminococcus sp.]MBR7007749.1 hypothetical protein [Ruminococcus sp.]